MMSAPQELLKEYVKSQYFTSTAEIMEDAKERTHDTSQTAVKMKLGVRGWGSGAGPV